MGKIHFLLILSFSSLCVTGKSIPASESEWQTEDTTQGWRNPVGNKLSPSYDQQQGQQNSKYYQGRDEFGKKDVGFNGFDEGQGQQEWRGKDYTERTTTFSPPKGGYYNQYDDSQKKHTTTRKPWYVRFRNWTNEKFKQLG